MSSLIGSMDLTSSSLKYAIEQAQQAKPILTVHPYAKHLAEKIAWETFGDDWGNFVVINTGDHERERSWAVTLSAWSRGE